MATCTSFVSLDLETTGLDPLKNEVLEIGAVRVENGNVTDEFSQLIRPKSEIPYRISQLTGLTEEDLRGQPSIEDILPRVSSFLHSSPIVCHNAPFDISFLSEHLALENGLWDTLELSRILVPWARNHRLETLLSLFGIQKRGSHRALEDARGVAQLFLRLLKHLEAVDLRTLKLMSDLVAPVEWGMGDILKEAVKSSFRSALDERKRVAIGDLPRPNVVGKRGETAEALPDAGSFFHASGPLSSILKGYEHREEQLEMAEEVARGFQEEAFLVCEAGTGIGKSLAYLVPALLWSAESGERVVVSTNTKNLQDQLFYKDIPLLVQCFHFDFKAVLLKGRANYLCLRKWFAVTSNPGLYLTAEERISMLPLVLWAEETESGDISENRGFRLPDSSSLWRKLRCGPNDCTGGDCHYHEPCFVNRVRGAAQEANLVVVNHSLLLSDLIAENKILGPYGRLLVDEAHNLEKVATEHLGLKVNPWTAKIPLDLLYVDHPVEKGLIPAVRMKIEKVSPDHPDSRLLIATLNRVKDLVVEGQERVTVFFEKLAELAVAPYGKLRYQRDHALLNELAGEAEAVLNSLSEICAQLSRAQDCLSELGPGRLGSYRETRTDLQGRLEDLKELLRTFNTLVKADDERLCYWVASCQGDSAELHGVPIEVGSLLATSLYPPLRSALFTSATLTVGHSFDYFLERTGLNLVGMKWVTDKAFGSPFDFSNQVLAVLPTYLPSPQQREFPEAIGKLLTRVVLDTKRGTLVLLTSHKLLNRLHEELREEFERAGVSLLAQGLGGSRTRLVEQFREETSSTLLGTDSFWEGVDVPGESLEILVISKLPFPVPSEPIVEARSEAIQARGGDPFNELMVPHTVIRFRQGFGRLIRNRRDRGVVVILDSRIVERDYGDLFLSSLPVDAELCHSLQEVEMRVREWWSEDR